MGTAIGLTLRFGEGLDALKNLARSAETGLTVDEKAAALVCGTAQLGCAALPAAFPPPPARPLLSASCVRARGLLFAIIASTFALFACSCIPIFAACGALFVRIGAATGKRRPRLPKGYAAVDT